MLEALLLIGTLAAGASDTTRFVVVNHGRPAGTMTVVREAAATRVRYGHVDRNRGRWLETSYRHDAAGAVIGFEARPLTREGAPTGTPERLELAGDSLVYSSGQQRQARVRGTEEIAWPSNRTPHDVAYAARTLLRSGGSGRLMPGGAARVEVVGDAVVPTRTGSEHVRFVMVHGQGLGPSGAGVWLDERDELFAGEVGWFIAVREGAAAALAALREVELRYREQQAAELAQRAMKPVERVLAIRNGDVFDAETGTMLPRRTVIVRDGRITSVGPAATTEVPAGATVIDATGKTVMPGLWEMHGHLQHTSQLAPAIMQLAMGITTVRDLAADIDVAVSHRDRADRHDIVSPRLILGGFLEGPGEWAGPSEAIAGSVPEALAWIARYDSLGYRQVKLYNLIHPDLVPAIAAETRRRGMILSGHVPRGLTVPTAVRLGFDEINHAAFLLSTFFQDSLYTPEMRPYSAVAAAVAPRFDVNSAQMTSLISLLRERGTVIDGTFNLWMNGRTLLDGGTDAAATSYARLLKRLYDAGVTLVPGTDNVTSSTYITELELYEHAGIPAPAVLQMATIVSARVMGDDAAYGSIAPGKVADILIVDGRPAERITALLRVEHVIRAGRVYRPAELRASIMATQQRRADERSDTEEAH